ncbi:DUF418 domain-containing protein [Virgibacillus halophilus]|uniref:DUF418 domain-containing protein n=3 Tax=Tigheibacillus halophilus TaxID=361280 RepID=A0ABU5C5L9_9BACI|nr:DUF418 domain-containing protein [Virgibacillus halophilus]
MFLMGLYAAKRGVFSNYVLHKPFVKRTWLYSLWCSIPLSIGIFLLRLKILDFGVMNEQFVQILLIISGVSLSLFYISSILLLLEKERWKKVFHPLSYIGRMALTVYIMQTMIGVGIFTGFGIFGTLNLRLGILISFIVFPMLAVFSFVWLQYFRFGPLEWAWRSFTYGKLQSIKINRKSAI